MTLRALLLAAALLVRAADAPPALELRVVKLPARAARLKTQGRPVALMSGSRAFTVPPDALTAVVSGEVWALLGDVLVKARAGDAFIFHSAGGRARLFVSAGTLDLVRPSGAATTLRVGDHADFGPPR